MLFQDQNLFPHLTVAGNVAFGLGGDKAAKMRRVEELLEKVNLSGFSGKHPHELSGGEQQRVAMARALIHKPLVIVADEPTGNLDTRTSHEIMETLRSLNREQGVTIIVVTHESDIAAYADRLSVRPGETIAFKVSSQLQTPYRAKLVRVICGDANPAGPGLKEEPVTASFADLTTVHATATITRSMLLPKQQTSTWPFRASSRATSWTVAVPSGAICTTWSA